MPSAQKTNTSDQLNHFKCNYHRQGRGKWGGKVVPVHMMKACTSEGTAPLNLNLSTR